MKKMLLQMTSGFLQLESTIVCGKLRPTTFGTSPLSKGWGRPEAEINPQTTERHKTQDSKQDSSLYKHFLVFYIIQ
jgi:hypothetical protein